MFIDSENQTLFVASQLAKVCTPPLIIYLSGSLGAGKTTFSRGFLRGFGFKGRVKSPTYTLVELYSIGDLQICHFDLYRIQDPGELELMGIRDYFDHKTIALIEWPELSGGLVPSADIICRFNIEPQGRELIFSSNSVRGNQILNTLTPTL